jgi:hypothetical protein
MPPRSVQKKKHHYVPVTYLNQFADASGKVFTFKKGENSAPFHVRPREIAFERYYYSQPLPDGGRDNNALEDLFSETESCWPDLVADLTARRNIAPSAHALFNFISLLRVRVPAARDAAELTAAHIAKRKMNALIENGKLRAPPANLGPVDISWHPEFDRGQSQEAEV